MELLKDAFMQDRAVLGPILFCSILVVAAAINRAAYYSKNKRDVVVFIPRLRKELERNNLDGAHNLAIQLGGVTGEVVEEGVRIFREQKNGFARSFDISANLATRKLEKHLSVLGTIGGVAPF